MGTGTPSSISRPASCTPWSIPRVNWLYKSEPSEWTGGRAIAAPRGKTLGGSSSINGHIYNRGQRLDFDGWAQRGNRGWGYADVLPYFRRSERRVGEADDTFRGRDGNLPITDLDWRDPICEAFIEGARAAGHPAQPRLQRHPAGGRELRAAHHPERHAQERRPRLPASGDEAPQPHRSHQRPCDRRSCWKASAPSACATARVAGTAAPRSRCGRAAR